MSNMTPDHIMETSLIFSIYQTGDEKPWSQEFVLLLTEHTDKVVSLLNDINENGIQTPILLGDDGRVWDGHHRLLCAKILGISQVPVTWGGDPWTNANCTKPSGHIGQHGGMDSSGSWRSWH